MKAAANTDGAPPLPMVRATLADAPRLARLFAASFAQDPVFDWLMRSGETRLQALQHFFHWTLENRLLPQGETWIDESGHAAAAWVPPYGTLNPSFSDDMRLLPVLLRLTGLPRLTRGIALAAAIERVHPRAPCFYLAFIGVAPRMWGKGLGAALLRATLARVDAAAGDAYLENSNPRNLALYRRAGFSTLPEVRARAAAPPIYPMWRPGRAHGSSTMSQ